MFESRRVRHERKMFFVYVLRSRSSGDFYTGHSGNLLKRVEEHNSGLSPSTKNRGPWDLVHHESFATRAGAMRRERELKTGKGRDEVQRILRSKPIDSSIG